MQRLRLPLLAAALATAMLVAAPTAGAPGFFTGPLAFSFESQDCTFAAQSPPGVIVVALTQADGVVWGNQVQGSPSVLMVLDPGGYVICQLLPSGLYRTAGDGSGHIVAA